MVTVSCTAAGLHSSDLLRQRYKICAELKTMCDMMIVDLGYSVTPAVLMLDSLLSDNRFKHLGFIDSNCIKRMTSLDSPLSDEDSKRLSSFLYSLGKSDIKGQIKLIENFRNIMAGKEEYYKQEYIKKSKLNMTFSFCAAAVFALAVV